MGWARLEDAPKENLPSIHEKFGGRAKYLVDESLGIAVFQVIQHLGHNVKYRPEIGLAGRSDEEVFARAWKDGRVILTHDHDFSNDQRFPFSRNPGVVILPGASGPEAIGLTDALRTTLDMFSNVAGLFPNSKIVITADTVWHVRTWRKELGIIEKADYWFRKDGVFMWETD